MTPKLPVKAGSMFSGIGGFDLACERAGIKNEWMIEKEPFAQRVLRHRFKDTVLYDDVTTVETDSLARVDILTGGFPCQDLSIAGKRAGLSGSRSGLFWEIVRLAKDLQPQYLLLENVPGLLSSNEGKCFGLILDSLDELGYGLAWRVLDAKYTGVPQRRRRVFIVGNLGGPCRPEILFESESSGRHTTESEEEGKETPRNAGNGIEGNSLTPWDYQSVRIQNPKGVASPLTGCDDGGGRHPQYVVCNAEGTTKGIHNQAPLVMRNREGCEGGGKGPLLREDESLTLASSNDQVLFQPIAFETKQTPTHGEVTPTLRRMVDSSGGHVGVVTEMAVRRLTPLECERLQGFPDGWTDIPNASDTPRYKALGNAVAVPCVEWIINRIVRYGYGQ